MLDMDYQQSNADHTISFQHNSGKVAVLILYVDDIKTHLAQTFEVKDLGPLRYLLGIEVARSSHGIFFLSKSMYLTY